MKILVLALVLSIMIVPLAMAQTNSEDLLKAPGLTDDERAAIAKAIGKANPPSSIPETIKGMLEWREMGDAFATTIKQICQTLNVEVNAFLKSDVGKLTAAVIIYKMVGKDILRIVLYTLIWLGVTFCFGIVLKFLHMPKKVERLVEAGGQTLIEKHYVPRFSWEDNEPGRMLSLFGILIVWFIFTAIIAANII